MTWWNRSMKQRNPIRAFMYRRHAARAGRLLAISGIAASMACGDSDSVQTPEALLSFEPILGHWQGDAQEANGRDFWIDARLVRSAPEGDQVGGVSYGVGVQGINEPDCHGTWHAVAVNGRTYTVSERIQEGPCPNGTVVLEHDPQTATLSYDYTPGGNNPRFQATGTLQRVGS